MAQGTANSGVNAIDPKFKVPSNWKYALGLTYEFDLPGNWGSGYVLNADLIYTKAEDSALVVNGTMAQVGTAPDGRPIYQDSRAFRSDYILSNVKGADARSTSFSVGLNKSYDSGWDWALGYAYTKSEDVSPMTSSVAFSNFVNIAVDDPNRPRLATSNYEIPHRFTFRVSYEARW